MNYLSFADSGQLNWAVGANDLRTHDNQFVCVYWPADTRRARSNHRLLIVVHGYSARKNNAKGRRLVRQLACYWGEQITDRQWLVMAPHFDEKRFDNDYQRLNQYGLQADARLNRLIEMLDASIFPNEIKDRFLLGFSGGGQFVHRYLAFNDQIILRSVIGAPGWFMWPDVRLTYPLGLWLPDETDDARMRLRRLCRQEMLLLVGDKDTDQGAFRKTYRQIDLCILQGAGRRERAKNWYHAIKHAAKAEDIECHIRFQLLKNTYHRVNTVFTQKAMAFLDGTKR